MKTAFPHWQNRIAPVFDTARQILVVESQSGMITGENQVELPDNDAAGKVLRLVELQISSLVCGALSRPLFQMITAYGIEVIPFLAGDLEEIVRLSVAGELKHEVYAMPGCRMRRGRRSSGFSLPDCVHKDLHKSERPEGRCRDGQQRRQSACHAAGRWRKR